MYPPCSFVSVTNGFHHKCHNKPLFSNPLLSYKIYMHLWASEHSLWTIFFVCQPLFSAGLSFPWESQAWIWSFRSSVVKCALWEAGWPVPVQHHSPAIHRPTSVSVPSLQYRCSMLNLASCSSGGFEVGLDWSICWCLHAARTIVGNIRHSNTGGVPIRMDVQRRFETSIGWPALSIFAISFHHCRLRSNVILKNKAKHYTFSVIALLATFSDFGLYEAAHLLTGLWATWQVCTPGMPSPRRRPSM